MDSKLLIACLILILLYGCSSVEHVPTARVERDSIYMTKIGEITVQGLGILCLTALVVWMIRRKGKQP